MYYAVGEDIRGDDSAVSAREHLAAVDRLDVSVSAGFNFFSYIMVLHSFQKDPKAE